VATGTGDTGRGSYRAALAHRDFRLMLSSFAISSVGSWAYNIALWVWVFDKTGSAGWVAATSFARFVPTLVLSTYGGVLAERFERTTVMRVCDGIAMVTMGGLAVTAALDGPPLLALLFAAMTSMSAVANDPAVQAMIPQVVGEKDLAAANASYGMVDNLAVIVGPVIGAALLFVGPPSVAFAVNAATFGISVLLVSRMVARSTPTDVTEGGGAGLLAQVMVGVRAITSSTSAAVLVGFSVLATFVYGIDTVLFILLAEERYGAGEGAVGYLLTGLGVGGILAAGLVNRLASLPRLGVVITVGMLLYCLPIALLVVVDDFAVAVALQVVRGAGTLVVDVLAITALQRSLPSQLLARVFGAFNTLLLAAVALGALITPVVLGYAGLDTTLLLAGFGISLVVLATWPWLRRMDREALRRLEELRPRIAVLEVLGIFSSVPRNVLERLARRPTEIDAPSGTTVVREGEVADALYVIASGEVAVTAADETGGSRFITSIRGPGYFGEIGLLEGIPRIASVETMEPSRLWRIDGTEFLDSLNEAPAAPAFLETARVRRSRTQAATLRAAEASAAADPSAPTAPPDADRPVGPV
jgi:CRP-like cAMP-binding protein/predicted MFS family arabinose efflux permease